MKRTAFVATLLGLALFATAPRAAKTLPERTALADFAAFVQKNAGEANDVSEEYGRYRSTIGTLASVGFFEDVNDGQDIDEIVQFVLRSTSRNCTFFRPTGFARQELDGMTLVRTSVRCGMAGVELHGEELIIADAARYQNFSVGGSIENRDKIATIATRMFDALVAAYR